MTRSTERAERLVMRYLAIAEGEGPDRAEKFLDSCGHDAAEVRARISDLEALGLCDTDAERGKRIGDWRIAGKIGQGGMGVVYAVDSMTSGERAALKCVRPGSQMFADVRERFSREISAIQALDHPGITRILTFGTDENVPYYVMERVEGISLQGVIEIMRADAREPSTLSRQDLANLLDAPGPCAGPVSTWADASVNIIRGVADALAHAHERGIMHRDIKPSNILLRRDVSPVLVDFGLAGGEAFDAITRTGTFLGAPLYAPPEVLEGKCRERGPRQDVYSLGVTLLELLMLEHPFWAATDAQARRNALRGVSSAFLRKANHLPRDLLTICATALDPDPERRYANAAGFRADLDNLLELRSVQAKAPRLLLRVRRWARRNVAATIGLTVGGLILLFGAVLILRERDRRLQRDHTLASLSDIVDPILETRSDPTNEQSWNQLLNRVSQQLIELYSKMAGPANEKTLRHTLMAARMHQNLHNWGEARDGFQRILDLRDHLGREHEFMVLEAHLGQAYCQLKHSRLSEAAQSLTTAFRLADELQVAPDHPLYIEARRTRGALAVQQGYPDFGVAELGECLWRSTELWPENDIRVLEARRDLFYGLEDAGRFEEALEHGRIVVSGLKKTCEGWHELLTSTQLLGHVCRRLGRFGEAENLYQEAMVIARAQNLLLVGHADSPYLGNYARDLALLYTQMGEFGEAEAYFTRSLEDFERLEEEHSRGEYIGRTTGQLAVMLAKANRKKEAVAACQRSIPHLRVRLTNDSEDYERVFELLEDLLGESPEALDKLRRENLEALSQLVEHRRQRIVEIPWGRHAFANVSRVWGRYLLQAERYVLAERALRDSEPLLTELYGQKEPRTKRARADLVTLYKRTGREDLAKRYK